jgi:hypothetical protein
MEEGKLGQLDILVGDELVYSPGRIERTFSSLDEVVVLIGQKLGR